MEEQLTIMEICGIITAAAALSISSVVAFFYMLVYLFSTPKKDKP